MEKDESHWFKPFLQRKEVVFFDDFYMYIGVDSTGYGRAN